MSVTCVHFFVLGLALTAPSHQRTVRKVAPKRAPRAARQQLPDHAPYLQKAMEIVEDLVAMPESEAFREPVNAEALGLTDYYSIIKVGQF